MSNILLAIMAAMSIIFLFSTGNSLWIIPIVACALAYIYYEIIDVEIEDVPELQIIVDTVENMVKEINKHNDMVEEVGGERHDFLVENFIYIAENALHDPADKGDYWFRQLSYVLCDNYSKMDKQLYTRLTDMLLDATEDWDNKMRSENEARNIR